MGSEEGVHVVFGAGGGLGGAIVRTLGGRGKPVRGVTHSDPAAKPPGVPPAVPLVAADASDPAAASRACEGASVIYHCANAPYTQWPKLFPPITDGIIEAAASSAAKLVFADNLYMYGPVEGRIHENLPYAGTGKKAVVRTRMAAAVMDAHAAGRIRATIGRASDFFGPGVHNAAMGDQVFRPALSGGTVDLLGNIDVPHTCSFIDDFAKALITLGERDEALGEVWHAPSAPPVTTRQFLDMVFSQTQTKPKVRVAPKALVTVVGWFNPMMREIKEMLYSWEKPYIVDDSKFERAFGRDVTVLPDAIERTVAWFRANPA